MSWYRALFRAGFKEGWRSITPEQRSWWSAAGVIVGIAIALGTFALIRL
ncbi:MAG: hypothetical protein AAGH57_10545 [Pseudomonadota bacterium]